MDTGGWAQPEVRYPGPPGMGLSDLGASWQKSQGRGEGWYSCGNLSPWTELHRKGRSRSQEAAK